MNETVIKAAQNNDSVAFETLLREHYALIFRFAYKFTGNKENAEDITQNVCLKLTKAIFTYDFQSKFSSWLYRLTINAAIDWQRQNKKHISEPLTNLKNTEPLSIENQTYAHEVLMQVQKLPENQKLALLLTASEGLTHHEASLILNCKESTVSGYVHEARKRLNAIINSER